MTNRRWRPVSTTVKRVPWACSECGDDLMVPYNRIRLRNLCDECAADQAKRWAEEHNDEIREKEKLRKKFVCGDHRMVVDVDGSWTQGTHLNRDDIVVLAACGYIAQGTVFECRGERLVVRDFRLVTLSPEGSTQ